MAGRFSVSGVFKLHDRMTAPIARIEKRMQRMTRVAGMELGRLDRRMDAVGRGMRKMGIAAAAGAAAAGAGLAAVIKPALELEQSMAKLRTVTTPLGDMGVALQESRKAALDWSKAHTQSAEEFLEANYNMASAGLNSAQALAGTQAALTLATAALGDAATAGNLLATIYNNMGDKTADAGTEMMRLADVLAKTQALFQIKDLAQLNESMKMGAPAAIQYGVSVEQLANAVGALNTAGLQGSMAGTAFSASMRNMLKASKALHFQIAKTSTGGVDFAGTLQNIAAKYGSFEKMTDRQKGAFQKAFGDEGLRAISLLLGKTDQFAASLDAVTNSTGEAARAAATLEGTAGAKLQILANNASAIAAEIGTALLPALTQLIPVVQRVSDGVAKWVQANGSLIASRATEYVQSFIKALPEIVKWGERIAIAVGVFWGMATAVKAAENAIILFKGTIGVIKAIGWAIEGIAAANTLVATTSIAASAGVSGLALPILAAIGLAVSLAAIAGAIGYALASWLIPQSFIDSVSDLLADLMGVNDTVNKIGRSKTRGTGSPAAPYVPYVPPAFTPAGAQSEFFGAGATVAPQIASPQERTAMLFSEEHKTMTDQSVVTIKDETGRAAVTQKPKRAALKMQHSGAF